MSLLDFPSPSAASACNRPYVDLGLSVYWATMNIGARFEYEYGDSFRWGEILPAKGAKYKFFSVNRWQFTRYITEPANNTDYQSTLLTEDDAAQQQWGGKWRMPTVDEMEELYRQCHWQALLINRTIRAYRITGQNGNAILLPQVDIWTSSLHRDNQFAYGLHFGADWDEHVYWTQDVPGEPAPDISGCVRANELSIRPVLPKS